MKKLFSKIRNWYSVLPDKKRHIELLSAILTVPMMLTVILVNFNNIKAQKEKISTTSTTTPIQVVIDNPNSTTTSSTPTTTKSTTVTPSPTQKECKKEIGPIEILSPQEGEIITTDNVCINISTNSDYCPVTWSYKLNNSSWSDFNNNDICLYNLTPGKKQLEIKIKSTVGDKTITLERNFTYQTSSATPTATASATTN